MRPNETLVRKTVWTTKETWKRARIAALKNNEPFLEFLERALRKEIAREKETNDSIDIFFP